MKKVFLVGVGGIGVSSLAKYLFKNNYQIFGSDEVKNENIDLLEKDYSLVFFNKHSEKNIDSSFEFLIYSPAISEDNPERKRARKLGIKEYSYPEFLGKISKDKFTISVAGTNGKTTTTTMLMELLDYFSFDPTVVVGGVAKKFGTNFLAGLSGIFLVESCEYKDSFLHLHPNIIIITNISPDHLDYFGSFEKYKKVFLEFLKKAKSENRILICPQEDDNLKEIVERAKELNFKIIDYQKYRVEKVSIPGDYNRQNAQAALALIDALDSGLLNKAKKYLKKDFVGSGRRFEYIGETEKGLKVYDDYAHNPEGLDVLLSGLKEKFPDKKVIIVFQPHLFSRTEDFFDDFVKAISKYHLIYLMPIYKARENPDDFSISSKMLFEEIKKKNSSTFFCDSFLDCQAKIAKENYNSDYILITVGAGDVYKVGKNLLE